MGKVGILMGSKSDFDVVKPAVSVLKKFGVETEVRVISAHRTPEEAHEFAATAKEKGIEVIICAAGKAAHLGGVIAAFTTLPVIGLPVKTDMMGGLDSLLSIVQMPAGIPVATVGVNGGENAGLLAFFSTVAWKRAWDKITTLLLILIMAIPLAIIAYILYLFLM